MAEVQQDTTLGEGDLTKANNPSVLLKTEETAENSNLKDADNEDNEKTTNSVEQENMGIKICSPCTKETAETSENNPFASASLNKSKSILKPPQLSVHYTSNNSSIAPCILNPSRLNIFGKDKSEDNVEAKNSQTLNGEALKFVPLFQSTAQTSSPPTTTITTNASNTTPTFVFGQNLQDRVITVEKFSEESKPSTSLSTNGTSEMLFSNAVKNDGKLDNKKETTKTLSEFAREYEESRANKRKYEEVEVITGEEGETNILSVTCKLFSFDKRSSSWQERGRGNLRLNDLEIDDNCTQSRLVFRTTGSLRVILNTKIWAEMTVEQASEKSIRFTALDANGEIRVFLIMANIEDAKHIYTQLQSRVQKENNLQKQKKNPRTETDLSGDN